MNKKEFWHGGILGFLRLFFFVSIWFGVLICGMLFFDDINSDYASYFILFYLTCSLLGIIFYPHRDKFTRENFKSFPKKIILFSNGLLKFLSYLILLALGIVGIIALVIVAGWIIAGLSAMSIIIILLFLILLK
jgi:hypothetical protein